MTWPAVILLALLAGGAVVLARRRLLVVTVVGGSMVPTYHPGDRVLVLRTSKLRCGRVVVARPLARAATHEPLGRRPPNSAGTSPPAEQRRMLEAMHEAGLIVKRVAALPGDDVPRSVRDAVTEATVPAGRLVLLGDSRASADSRAWGFAAVEDVLGVVVAELHRAPTPGGASAPSEDSRRLGSVAYVALWCRMTVAGVFLVSLATKVRGRVALAEFVSSVGSLGLLPRRWSQPAAYGAVASEAGAVILLSAPAIVRLGFVWGAALLAVFTVGIGTTLRRGERTPCRCFGASTTPLGRPHLIRNLALIAVCATGLVATTMAADQAWNLVGVTTALVTAATTVLLALYFDDVVALFASPEGPR